MKIFKSALRWWITLSSLAGFFGGWIVLAHAPKPRPQQTTYANASAALPLLELPPVPSLDSLLAQGGAGQSQRQLQPFQIMPASPPTTFLAPRIRTGGSG